MDILADIDLPKTMAFQLGISVAFLTGGKPKTTHFQVLLLQGFWGGC